MERLEPKLSKQGNKNDIYFLVNRSQAMFHETDVSVSRTQRSEAARIPCPFGQAK